MSAWNKSKNILDTHIQTHTYDAFICETQQVFLRDVPVKQFKEYIRSYVLKNVFDTFKLYYHNTIFYAPEFNIHWSM